MQAEIGEEALPGLTSAKKGRKEAAKIYTWGSPSTRQDQARQAGNSDFSLKTDMSFRLLARHNP